MIKLRRFNEGVWFDYPQGGRFKIRPVTPRDYLSLQDQATIGMFAVSRPDGSMEYVDRQKKGAFYYAVFNYMLQDYEDVEVEDAKTPEEIREAIFNDQDLRDWITSKSQELFSKRYGEFEKEIKNSTGSQSG